MVPIGERALAWIDRYVIEVRPSLVVAPDEGYPFLTHLGESFMPNRLTQLVREYVDEAQIGKRGACHLFRPTMATLMLEGGADVRFIQEMLGHAPGRAARAREGHAGDVVRRPARPRTWTARCRCRPSPCGRNCLRFGRRSGRGRRRRSRSRAAAAVARSEGGGFVELTPPRLALLAGIAPSAAGTRGVSGCRTTMAGTLSVVTAAPGPALVEAVCRSHRAHSGIARARTSLGDLEVSPTGVQRTRLRHGEDSAVGIPAVLDHLSPVDAPSAGLGVRPSRALDGHGPAVVRSPVGDR